jgi:hypothetical protein
MKQSSRPRLARKWSRPHGLPASARRAAQVQPVQRNSPVAFGMLSPTGNKSRSELRPILILLLILILIEIKADYDYD